MEDFRALATLPQVSQKRKRVDDDQAAQIAAYRDRAVTRQHLPGSGTPTCSERSSGTGGFVTLTIVQVQ